MRRINRRKRNREEGKQRANDTGIVTSPPPLPFSFISSFPLLHPTDALAYLPPPSTSKPFPPPPLSLHPTPSSLPTGRDTAVASAAPSRQRPQRLHLHFHTRRNLLISRISFTAIASRREKPFLPGRGSRGGRGMGEKTGKF